MERRLIILLIATTLILGCAPLKKFIPKENEIPKGIYTVGLDDANKIIKGPSGETIQMYVSGVALSKHVLIVPLGSSAFRFAGDAEGKKFILYYMDTNTGLAALITREKLETARLSANKNYEGPYLIVYHKQNLPQCNCKISEKTKDPKLNIVNFIFNERRELIEIFFEEFINTEKTQQFHQECLDEIKKDGGVDKIFEKLVPNKKILI